MGDAEPHADRPRARPRLDAAIAWAVADERLHLQLLWPEPLPAVVPARDKDEAIAAGRLRVLVDADVTSWETWNAFAREFAERTGARIVEIDDGGVAGPSQRQALRLGAPVLQGPKRDGAPLPFGLLMRPGGGPDAAVVLGRSSPAPTTTGRRCSRCARTPTS